MIEDISLFIPVKNGANFIGDCIDSILSQDFHAWKLYILDNRSTDGTYEACRKYLEDKRVTYILNESDLGMYGNFNKCLNLCQTKYYALLSHDDKYNNNQALSEAYKVLEGQTHICGVYSHVDWIDQNSKKIATRKSAYIGEVSSDKLAYESIVSCRCLFGVPILLRKSTLGDIRYDPKLFYTADVDLSISMGIGRSVHVMDMPSYAIRFHAKNNTARYHSETFNQMLQIAKKNRIKISIITKIIMAINNLKIRLGKTLFFIYLDIFRPIFSKVNYF